VKYFTQKSIDALGAQIITTISVQTYNGSVQVSHENKVGGVKFRMPGNNVWFE